MKLALEGERNAFRVRILRGQGMGMICDISFLGIWAEVNSAHLLREGNKMKDRNFSERESYYKQHIEYLQTALGSVLFLGTYPLLFYSFCSSSWNIKFLCFHLPVPCLSHPPTVVSSLISTILIIDSIFLLALHFQSN